MLEEFRKYIDPGATATDAVDGNLTSDIIISGFLDSSKTGFYLLRYNVSDPEGNKADEKRRIIKVIADTTKPTITLNGDSVIYVEVHNPYIELGAIASDPPLTISGYVDTSTIGIYSITYAASDARGNVTEKVRKVLVGDTTKPVISLKGNPTIYVAVFSQFNDPLVTVTDNYCAGDIPIITGAFNINKVGAYNLTYSISDCAGNGPVMVTRKVIVIDTVSPVIRFNEDSLEIEVYSTDYTDPEPNEVKDNYYKKLKVSKSGFVNVFLLGTYTLKYTATDSSGNVSDTAYLYVKVADTKSPVTHLFGDTVVIVKRWANYIDEGFYATDNYDKQLKVSRTGTFENTFLAGTFSYTYEVEDQSGNRAEPATRMIQVIEDSTTGVENLERDECFIIYPNPAKEFVVVNFDKSNIQSFQFFLTDLAGRGIALETIKIHADGGWYFDLSGIKTGVYVLTILSSSGSVSRPLIIE